MTSRNLKSPRAKFVIVALSLIVVIQLFAVIVSGLAARNSSIAVAEDAIGRDGDTTIESILRHLDPAEQSVEVTAELLARDLLLTGEPDLERYLYTQLAVMPQMTGAYVGYPDGSFVFVAIDGDGFSAKRITVGDEREVVIQKYDASFELRSSQPQPDDVYDPTVRPWYTLAAGDTSIVWTEPYVFFTSQSPGVTASRAVWIDGEVVAVVGVDVELSGLATFLDETASTESSEAFVVTGDTVVAAPSRYDERIAVEPDQSVRLLTAQELGIPGSESNADGTVTRVGMASGHELVLRQAFPDDQALQWDVIVRAPESEFTSIVSGQQRMTLIISLGGGVFVLLALAILWRITHPISQLHEMASTDPLTGLANRRRISEDGTRLLAQRTGGDQVAVLTIDLDGFKALNDAHGHEAGDRALVLVGDCLRDLAQPGSMVGRLGGDEFVVALPVQTVGAGVTRAKRILITVRQLLDAEFPDTELGVSGGIAVSSDAGDDFATLIREADRALISAKTDYRGMLQLADRLVSSAVVTD